MDISCDFSRSRHRNVTVVPQTRSLARQSQAGFESLGKLYGDDSLTLKTAALRCSETSTTFLSIRCKHPRRRRSQTTLLQH